MFKNNYQAGIHIVMITEMPHPSTLALIASAGVLVLSAAVVAYSLRYLIGTRRRGLAIAIGIIAVPGLYVFGAVIDVAARDWLWNQLRPQEHGFTPMLGPGPYYTIIAIACIAVGCGMGWGAGARTESGASGSASGATRA